MKNVLQRIIFHIDMDSFYASVEQQINPLFRGKPLVVLGHGKGTFIIAASKEAKRYYGIKVGDKIYDAKKICPDLIITKADIPFYTQVSDNIYNTFYKFTPFIERYSIDECFLDFSTVENIYPDYISLAYEIKKELKKTIGEYITCSIGIATNRLMSKAASDLVKPDGIILLAPNRYIQILDLMELKDMWGIGNKIEERLNAIGIYSFKDLRSTSLERLKYYFKESEGNILYNMARGQDSSLVIYDPPLPKSIGHNRSLPYSVRNLSSARKELRELCEELAFRMRRKKMKGKVVQLVIKNEEYQSFYLKRNMGEYSWDGETIFKNLEGILKPYILPITFLSIVSSSLIPYKNSSSSIFLIQRKKETILNIVDEINKKYAKKVIKTYCS